MTMRAITTANLPGRQTIEVGELYADDHPFVEKYPQFFEDIEASSERPIERATAAPGGRRDIRPEGGPLGEGEQYIVGDQGPELGADGEQPGGDDESEGSDDESEGSDEQPDEEAPADLTEGSVKVVLERVGDDVEIAAAALEQERAKAKPRSSLVSVLEAVVSPSGA